MSATITLCAMVCRHDFGPLERGDDEATREAFVEAAMAAKDEHDRLVAQLREAVALLKRPGSGPGVLKSDTYGRVWAEHDNEWHVRRAALLAIVKP